MLCSGAHTEGILSEPQPLGWRWMNARYQVMVARALIWAALALALAALVLGSTASPRSSAPQVTKMGHDLKVTVFLIACKWCGAMIKASLIDLCLLLP